MIESFDGHRGFITAFVESFLLFAVSAVICKAAGINTYFWLLAIVATYSLIVFKVWDICRVAIAPDQRKHFSVAWVVAFSGTLIFSPVINHYLNDWQYCLAGIFSVLVLWVVLLKFNRMVMPSPSDEAAVGIKPRKAGK